MLSLTKGVVATSLAALLAGATIAGADAAPLVHGGGGWHGGGAGWHGGAPGWRGGGWRGGGGGWWGPAAVGGLAAGAIVGAMAAPYAYNNGCYQYQPIYDASGAYLGSQLVNVCY